jgi:hypothetical protein
MDEYFSVADRRKRVTDIRFTPPHRLDLRASQYHARFVSLFDKIIMGRLFVLSERFIVRILLAHDHSSFSLLKRLHQKIIVASLMPKSKAASIYPAVLMRRTK